MKSGRYSFLLLLFGYFLGCYVISNIQVPLSLSLGVSMDMFVHTIGTEVSECGYYTRNVKERIEKISPWCMCEVIRQNGTALSYILI